MPNRILRDWTDSESIDQLSVYAERFFTRLIMKVDDFGRYNGNLKILKSTLFPLKTDVRETDITRWLAECEKSGLIVLYNIASKDYIQIENFKQTLRQKNEKYPAPDMNSIRIADDKQVHSICEHETKGKEEETERKGDDAPPQPSKEEKEYKAICNWIKEKAPRVMQMKEPLTMEQYYKLKDHYGVELIPKILMAMHNWGKLTKERVSAYLTFIAFAKKETAAA